MISAVFLISGGKVPGKVRCEVGTVLSEEVVSMVKFSQIKVGDYFSHRGYIYRRVDSFLHDQAGWVNAARPGYYRLFYDDTMVGEV